VSALKQSPHALAMPYTSQPTSFSPTPTSAAHVASRTPMEQSKPSEYAPSAFDFNTHPKVLIVDDENGPRQSLRMVLKEEFDVRLATGVDEAMSLLKEETVDLIITDIRMPHKTGMDLLREVRDLYEDIEIIILTGYGELDTAMKAIEYGAFAYLEKPFDHGTMMEKVHECMAKRRLEQDRKAMESLAMEANRFETLGRLISGTMHDLGTPLSVLGTHLEMLIADPTPESFDKRLGTMESQVRHCTELVRSTMNFLRHSPNEQTPFDINSAVQVCIEVANPLLTRHSIQVHTELSPDISICIGDFVLVRQALLNLIYNACQAMEGQSTSREILIRTCCEDGSLVLTIEDTGPGIPEQSQKRVFHTLFSTKGKMGTGLGLSVVKSVMQQHGGAVSLEQDEDNGARFKLTFPGRK
jgi:signal transduction histidine kinase